MVNSCSTIQPLVVVYVDSLKEGKMQEPDVMGQAFESFPFALKDTSDALKRDLSYLRCQGDQAPSPVS